MNAGADESLEVFKVFGKGLYDHVAKHNLYWYPSDQTEAQ